MRPPLVEVDDLHKAYRDGGAPTPVLKGASFALQRGETVSVVGSSGAGKSTLLSVLAGLTLPDSGAVRFDGQDVTVMSEAERADGIGRALEPAYLAIGDSAKLVAILRAGLGMVDGFLRLVPDARVGHLGMYRDEEALRPVGYYENVPSGIGEAETFVVDPMLATGGSATQAIGRLKRAEARRITFVCLVAAPEGVAALHEAHPEVPIITATLDRELDGNGYIRPGLGDAGDRVFGTDR